MSAQPNYFKLGLFIIVAVTLAIVAVVVLGAGKLFSHRIIIETYLNQSAQGLDVGSKVKFRGVTVGNISRIDFVPNIYPDVKTDDYRQQAYIVLQLQLDKSLFTERSEAQLEERLQQEVARGLRARLTAQGVTGTAYLELDYVNPGQFPPLPITWKPAHPYIPSAEGALARIVNSTEQIFAQLQRIDFEKIGTNTTALLANLNESSARLVQLLSDAQLRNGLSDASASMSQLRRFVESPEVSESLRHLQELLRQGDLLLTGKDADVQATLQNLRALTENLRELSESARQYPSQILFGNPPPPAKTSP